MSAPRAVASSGNAESLAGHRHLDAHSEPLAHDDTTAIETDMECPPIGVRLAVSATGDQLSLQLGPHDLGVLAAPVPGATTPFQM